MLWWQAYGSAVFLSNGGGINSPDKIAGKKVRVFGKTLGGFVDACGAAPTLISGSEQYLAYQRGIVDIGMTGVSGVKSRKLWEVMDTITKTQHGDIEFVVVVNDEFWKKLPAEDSRYHHRCRRKSRAVGARTYEHDRKRSICGRRAKRHEGSHADGG